jgi:hypothetical protein
MFPIQSTFGFAFGHPKSYISDEDMLCFYAQDYFGVYPNMLGGWYAPAPNSGVSPWAWQWSERTRIQEVCDCSPPLQLSIPNEYRIGRILSLTTHTRRASHKRRYNPPVLWTKRRPLSAG